MHTDDENIEIKGKIVDDNTRCVHYHSPLDVIAIKFKCCGQYYPCYQCHDEEAGHSAETWKKDEWSARAVFCGLCKTVMTIQQYMDSGNHCPRCNGAFNPNCSRHYHLYFEL